MNIARRCIACVAATLLSLSAPASALAQTSLIDASRHGSLSIHKSSGDPLTQYGDPTNPNANLDRSPIAGIRFEARKVRSIDLSSSEGWLQAEKLKPADFYAGGDKENDLDSHAFQAETGADGIARLENLPLGLYYVTETPSAAQDKHLSVVSPFLVTVPSTEPTTRDHWIYDVEIHAKDQKLIVNKEVNRRCADVGDTLTYTITGNAPAPQSDGKIHRYTIADPLQRGLEFKNGSEHVSISNRATGGKTTDLERGDYTFTVNAERIATMQLTPTGLEKLGHIRKGNPDAAVTTSFDVRIDAAPESGYIRDISYLLTEGYPEFDAASTPGVNSNEVKTAVPCSPGVNPIAPHIPGTGTPIAQGAGITGIAGGQQSYKGVDKLALTGASIWWALGAGAGMILAGAWLLRRRMRA